MKALIKCIFIFFIIFLLECCNKNNNAKPEEKNIKEENIEEQMTFQEINKKYISEVSIPILIGDNYDLFTDHYWSVSDGRYIENESISPIDWVGPMTPRVIFRKFELPTESIMYQKRLRNELFTIVSQPKESDKLFTLENSSSSNIYTVVFNNEYTTLSLLTDRYSAGNQTRIGKQVNYKHPLVGIWGKLPNLTEYRLIDTTGCFYYMEIDNEIPYFAVREGTYLLRQVDENVLETISSFPDGRLRLEIQDDNMIYLRPLFDLPDGEEGFIGLLTMYRSSIKISELNEEDNPYNQ